VAMVGECGNISSMLFIQSHLMTTNRSKPTISTSFVSRHTLLLGCGDGSLYVTDCNMPSSLPIKLTSRQVYFE